MKRTVCLLLAALLAFCLAACGDDKTDDTQASETAMQTEEPTDATENGLDLSALRDAIDRDAEIEEQLIYDEDDISITATGISYEELTGPEVLFSVTNHSEKDVVIQGEYAAVNGYMVDPELNIEVKAGAEAAEGNMTISYISLAMADITRLAEIRFSVRIADSELYQEIATSDIISLKTSAYADYEPSFDEEGQVAYDKKDIKLVLRGINNDRVFSEGAALTVYMYNGTDRAITVQTADINVNGYEFTSAMTTAILPGMHAVDIVTFFDYDMQEYGIEEIETVEISFEMKDTATWKNIGKTDIISVEI